MSRLSEEEFCLAATAIKRILQMQNPEPSRLSYLNDVVTVVARFFELERISRNDFHNRLKLAKSYLDDALGTSWCQRFSPLNERFNAMAVELNEIVQGGLRIVKGPRLTSEPLTDEEIDSVLLPLAQMVSRPLASALEIGRAFKP